MKKVTRRHAKAWLDPIRKCFAQMRQGEVDAIRGYAVTRLRADDDYARIDYCIAGFRGMIGRLFPDFDDGPIELIERRLANGLPLTLPEIDAAVQCLKVCEDAMVGLPRQRVMDAVMTEQIAIELDQLREATCP